MLRIKRLCACAFLLAVYSTGSYAQNFSQAATSIGLTDSSDGLAAAWGDYDNDGDLDIFVANEGQNFLYRNNGGGTFTNVAASVGLIDATKSQGAAWGDYDDDGDLDLFVANEGQNFLYRNDGGSFVEIATTVGMTDSSNGRAPAWADFDGDGDLDLFVANDTDEQDNFYRNDAGNFADIAAAVGMSDTSDGHSAAWSDYDNDGDLDLFVGNGDDQLDFLYRNDEGSFTNVAGAVGLTRTGYCQSAAWADYDNDGDFDLFVANSDGQQDFLYRNDNGAFVEIATTAGLTDSANGYGAAWGDYDDDGDLDLFVANADDQADFLYRNSGGVFTNVAASVGMTLSSKGSGAAWADYDDDGDLDIFVPNGGDEQDFLYRNPGFGGNWLILALKGSVSNKNAIGARVRAVSGALSQVREVSGGSGSQNSLPLEFGLGSATQINTLEILWPSGISQALTDVEANQIMTLVEGQVTVNAPTPQTGIPGQTLTYQFTIENVSTQEDSFDLSVTSTNGFQANLRGNTTVQLGSNQSTTSNVEVTVPLGALAGSTADLTLTATAQSNNSVTGSATLTTTVGQVAGVSVAAPLDGKGNPGDTVRHQFNVTNTGNGTDTYSLSANSDSGDWQTTLPNGQSVGPIASGDAATVFVDVAIPDPPGRGKSLITLTAASQFDPGVHDSDSAFTKLNDNPPSAPVIGIAPEISATRPATTDDIVCQITTPSVDPEGKTVLYTYVQEKDGVVFHTEGPAAAEISRISAADTARGQTWRFIVTATDGLVESDPVTSPPILVKNTPPIIGSVDIAPASPNANDLLRCRVIINTVSDADGDEVINYRYEWRVSRDDGATFETDQISVVNSTVNFLASDLEPDDIWRCIVQASDGVEFGPPIQDEVTIGGLRPTTLTLSVLNGDGEINFGDEIELTGALISDGGAGGANTIGGAGVRVTLISRIQGSVMERSDITNSLGVFRVAFKPDKADVWDAVAVFDGSTNLGLTSSTSIDGGDPPLTIIVNKAATDLSIFAASRIILVNDSTDVQGNLSFGVAAERAPNERVELTITSPTGGSVSVSTTTDAIGTYRFNNFPADSPGLSPRPFGAEGIWTAQATFLGSDNLFSSDSPPLEMTVVQQAGYAIIVEGKIRTSEGLEDHNFSTNSAYRTFLARGFLPSNILYYNFDTDQSDNFDPEPNRANADIEVDGVPSVQAVQDAIDIWSRDKLINSPAPLYVVFLDHGFIDTFFLDDETFTPTDLAAWLDQLDADLLDAEARGDVEGASTQPKVIIYGACFSGSFVPALSKPGRIIITSAAADEESFKGPLLGPGVRDGEFFLGELFRNLSNGLTITESFRRATRTTEAFVRLGSTDPRNGLNFGDNAGQHPLIDTNGDGTGSNELSPFPSAGEDGFESQMGVGVGKNAPGSVEIIEVSNDITLSPNDIAPAALTLKTDDINRTGVAFIEVKSPDFFLPENPTTTEQLVMNLANLLSDGFDPRSGSFFWNNFNRGGFAGFNQPGTYEIFYYVIDAVSGEVSEPKTSRVYRNTAVNRPPGQFDLISPSDGNNKVRLRPIFDWQDAADPDAQPDDGPVTYTLTITPIAGPSDAEEVVIKNLELSAFTFDPANGTSPLKDTATYEWRVTATDPFGGSTQSDTFTFIVDDPSASPPVPFLMAVVEKGTDNLIRNSHVRLTGGVFSETLETDLPNGTLFLVLPSGNYDANTVAVGFDPKNTSVAVVEPSTNITVSLDRGNTGSPTLKLLSPISNTILDPDDPPTFEWIGAKVDKVAIKIMGDSDGADVYRIIKAKKGASDRTLKKKEWAKIVGALRKNGDNGWWQAVGVSTEDKNIIVEADGHRRFVITESKLNQVVPVDGKIVSADAIESFEVDVNGVERIKLVLAAGKKKTKVRLKRGAFSYTPTLKIWQKIAAMAAKNGGVIEWHLTGREVGAKMAVESTHRTIVFQ